MGVTARQGMNKGRIIIIGAGIAGAATAYFLAQKGARNIVVMERESLAGMHSSGRNAAILRTLIPDSILYSLAKESVEFFLHPPQDFSDRHHLNSVGIYIGAPDGQSAQLQAWVRDYCWSDRVLELEPDHLYRRIPILSRNLASVVYQPDEGVVDIHALLQAFLSGAQRLGVLIQLDCEVKRLLVKQSRLMGVETAHGRLEAEQVVLATGGWGDQLAAAAGFSLPLVPYRRHLLVTQPLPQVDAQWPVVWLMGEGFYFRPESGGLLLCACDTVEVRPHEGEVVDPTVTEHIAAKASRWLPSLSEARAARIWSGMRTFARDDRFVIGPDPRLSGLNWVAGLGGHGITCSPAVGALAADWLINGGSTNSAAKALAPARLFS